METKEKKSESKKKTDTKKNKLGVKNSLVNNINAKKKKGESHSKKDSTVSKENYDEMEKNWDKKEKIAMAEFKISKATAKGKTWKAVGTNPKTGKKSTIQGGQEGTPVGDKNPKSEKSFDARHDATGMTPKKYINKLRWDNKAEIGTTVDIPDKLFKETKKKSDS